LTRPAGAAGDSAAFGDGGTFSAFAFAFHCAGSSRIWEEITSLRVHPHCRAKCIIAENVVPLPADITDACATPTVTLFHGWKRVFRLLCPPNISKLNDVRGVSRGFVVAPGHQRRETCAERSTGNQRLHSAFMPLAAGAAPTRLINKALENDRKMPSSDTIRWGAFARVTTAQFGSHVQDREQTEKYQSPHRCLHPSSSFGVRII
jgi:hypothetical protein